MGETQGEDLTKAIRELTKALLEVQPILERIATPQQIVTLPAPESPGRGRRTTPVVEKA